MSTPEPSSIDPPEPAKQRKRDKQSPRMTIEERKSQVRVTVTKIAAWWVFAGSAALVLASIGAEAAAYQIAKDVFMTVLPVATGVITYWFASRGRTSPTKE